MNPAQIAKYKEILVTEVLRYVPTLAAAVITLIIGLWLASTIRKLVRKGLERRRVDATLVPFITSLLGWSMKALVLLTVATMLGVKTTSFVALLGAAGLAIGLALQGSLANFAGGVLILIFRPYRVGDSIEAQGQSGTVKEIQIFTTTLTNGQNRQIIIPNALLSNGTIVNLTGEENVRVDLTIGISYDADIDEAKRILNETITSIPHVLPHPAPVVAVLALGENAVQLVMRPHTLPGHYWDVHFAAMEACKKALDAAKIKIPSPQREVHVFERKSA